MAHASLQGWIHGVSRSPTHAAQTVGTRTSPLLTLLQLQLQSQSQSQLQLQLQLQSQS
jgi:hypothetical protein